MTDGRGLRVGVDADWRAQAMCRYQEPGLFDPPEGKSAFSETSFPRLRAAVEVCGTCPVVAECGADAATIDGVAGVWAGLWWVDGRPRRIPPPPRTGVRECVICGVDLSDRPRQHAATVCGAECRRARNRAAWRESKRRLAKPRRPG